MLNYTCPQCGTSLGFDGLCWECRAVQHRAEVLNWTEDELRKRIGNIVSNIDTFEEWGEGYNDFFALLCCRGISSPEVARAALEKEIYSAEIYYHAPENVGQELIKRLLALDKEDDAWKASGLMECVAMYNGPGALDCMYDLEQNPRPWRKQLYVDSSRYSWKGGWTFDKEKKYIPLIYDTCLALKKGERMPNEPLIIGQRRDDFCACGCRMVDLLTIDGDNPALSFLGIEGKAKVSCCPNCVQFGDGIFCRNKTEGENEVLPYEVWEENYVTGDELDALENNAYVLDEQKKPLFYGCENEDLNTVGGFGNWVQDTEHMTCPDCRKIMKYMAQLQFSVLLDMEGTLFVEYCPDCKMFGMLYQTT